MNNGGCIIGFRRLPNGDLELLFRAAPRYIAIQWILSKDDRRIVTLLNEMAKGRGINTRQFMLGPLRIVWTNWT